MTPGRDRARPIVVGLLVLLLVGAVVAAWSVLTSDDSDVTAALTDLAESTDRGSANSTTTSAFPAIEDSAIRDGELRTEPVPGTLELVETIDHDTSAFTQGLEFDGSDLYEGTGLTGESTLRQVDPETGSVLRSIDLPEDVFGEGLTIVGDEIIQLTWTSEIAYRWDIDDLELIGTFDYDGEGWGLCDFDDRLVMSNGSSELTFRRIDDFSVIDRVQVTFNGAPVERLNELECVDGTVWANIWQTPLVVQIEPETGLVLTVIDAGGLRPEDVVDDPDAVLNGIAYDEGTDTFLLSGKLWPTTFRVRLGGA